MSIKDRLRAAVKWSGTAVPDALMVGGAAGISYGAWLVYAPSGYIVGGILALVGGVILARSAG